MQIKYLNIFIGALLVSGIVLISLYVLKPTETTKAESTAKSEKQESLHLRFGHNTPVESALHEAAVRFAEIVERESGGEVIIDIYPSQELGNDYQMVEMAREGELDILLTPTAKMSVAVPSMQYADLPFYFPTREDVYMMLDGEPGAMLLDDLRSIGLIGVTFWENGFKHFTGNQPLVTPGDFKGKKIRVMKSRIIMEQFTAFGAESLPIDFHSTKKALADRVVDGQENPLVAIVSMGFHEVQSDLTLSEHAYLGYVFSISEKVFKQLPQDVRILLMESAKAVTPWERKETQRREEKLLEIIKQAGVTVHTLTKEQRQQFALLTRHIAKQYEEEIGSDVISKTEEILMKKYGPSPDSGEQILIGVNADLSADGSKAGLAIKRGVELAVNEINDAGGLLGKPLAIMTKDHRVLPSHGVQNIKELTDREDVVAIVGGKHSAVISAELSEIHQQNIPYLIPWAAAAELTDNDYHDNFVFRVSANDAFISDFLIKHALEHGERTAIIVENSIWGRNNLERMKQYLEEKGKPTPVSFVVNRGEASFGTEAQQIKAANINVIVLVANPVEGTMIVSDLAKGYLKVPIVSHWGIIGGDFYAQNRENLKELHLEFLQSFSFDNNNPNAQKLETEYRKVYGIDSKANIGVASAVAQAYDCVQLLALAIKKSGSTDRAKVKEALEKLPSYHGMVKYYNPAFTAERHDALNVDDFYFSTFDNSGKIVPVYREPFKQH